MSGRKPPTIQCSVDGCDGLAPCKNLCPKHYKRMWRYGDPTTTFSNRDIPAVDRFWSHVDKTAECWEWQVAKSTGGYGQIIVNGVCVYAHRFSFFLHNGYWPTLMVLHSCDNRKCVNPDHLREGTATDNAADMLARHPKFASRRLLYES